MKTLISCLTVVLTACTLSAQSLSPTVVATAGETYTSPTVNVEWTLGELMIESYAGTLVLTQGFHQPTVQITSLKDLAASLGTIKVYPNPTTSSLSIESEKHGNLQVALWDMNGRLLLQKRLSATISQLELSHLPQGIYVLRMTDGQRATRSIRIEKL